MKNSLEWFNCRFDQAEERISELKDRTFVSIESEEQKEKNNEEKRTEPKGLMGYHQEDQNTHHESPRRIREPESGRKIT